MDLKRKIGLGTVQFGMPYGISNRQGTTSPEEVAAILDLAREQKILLIDTASAYGAAEKTLGKFPLEGFQVISKFMPPGEKSAREQLENSLSNLGLYKLYGYLAHRAQSLLENPELWGWLGELKEQKVIEKRGVSLNEAEELDALQEAGIVPDLVQAPYNWIDRRFEPSLERLKGEGCEVHLRSTFLQGLFFVEPDRLSDYFDPVKPLIGLLQKRYGSNEALAGSLLKYSAERSFADHVIMGVESLRQFRNNLEAIDRVDPLPERISELGDKADIEDIDIPVHILKPWEWPH